MAALVVAFGAGATQADLFTRLDSDADGYLTAAELHVALHSARWAARDRDRDGRIGREEFWLHAEAEPAGYTARELLGMPVHNRTGEQVGEVRDLVVDARGRVAALALGERFVSWHHARVGRRYITLFAAQSVVPRSGRRIWRATQLLDARARSGLPAREALVADLVILPGGQVANVVLRYAEDPTGRGPISYRAWTQVQFLVPRR